MDISNIKKTIKPFFVFSYYCLRLFTVTGHTIQCSIFCSLINIIPTFNCFILFKYSL